MKKETSGPPFRHNWSMLAMIIVDCVARVKATSIRPASLVNLVSREIRTITVWNVPPIAWEIVPVNMQRASNSASESFCEPSHSSWMHRRSSTPTPGLQPTSEMTPGRVPRRITASRY